MFDAIQAIYDWLTVGIYDLIKQAGAWILVKLFTAYVEAKIWGLTLAWDIGKAVYGQLNLSAAVQNAWSGVPPQFVSTLTFFRIPECLNIIFAGGITAFVMRWIPFV